MRLLLLILLLVPAVAAGERYERFGDYQVHYNVLPTGMLQPQVADDYGIIRSRQRGLLTVALLRAGKPVPAGITAVAIDSDAREREVRMRTIREDPSVYYIGTFRASAGEKLIFRLDVEPDHDPPESAPFSVNFIQHFYGAR